MLTLPVAAARIQREMQALEATLNLAMAQAAAVTQSCALARNLPEVGANAGQDTMLRLASLSQHLVQGASDAARVHGGLLDLGRQREVMLPDGDGDCPPAVTKPTGVAAA